VGAALLAYTAGGREIGPDLYDPAARAPEVMEAVSGTSVAWIRPLASYTVTKATVSIARGMTAGFRLSDGSVAWRDPGTVYMCGELPCPGQGIGGGTPDLGIATAGNRHGHYHPVRRDAAAFPRRRRDDRGL
jgi:hypothetical protein